MLTQSQVSMLTGNMERSAQRPAPTDPQRPQPYTQRPPRRGRGLPQVQLVEVDVDPELYMHRRNNLPEALGKFRRYRICGHDFFYSHDSWAWWIPTVITFWIVVGNMAVAWPTIGWVSFIVVVTLVSTGFTASYLVTCTDPGIYPRLQPGEVDPLASYEDLVLCRVCQIRRPPRTAHCYQCNVCVLAHDHHCGVIGGCVGQRSLRWFTLFLVCQSTACCIGVYWLIYFFVVTVYELGTPVTQQRGERNITQDVTSTPLPAYLSALMRNQRLRGERRNAIADSDVLGLRHVGAVFMVLIDLVIITLVGGLGVMYVYLTVSSTTRRESQKRENSMKICCEPRKMLANIIETAFPPHSLMTGEAAAPFEVAVEEVHETDRLV